MIYRGDRDEKLLDNSYYKRKLLFRSKYNQFLESNDQYLYMNIYRKSTLDKIYRIVKFFIVRSTHKEFLITYSAEWYPVVS